MGAMGKGNGVLIFNGDIVAHYMKIKKLQRWMMVMVVQHALHATIKLCTSKNG